MVTISLFSFSCSVAADKKGSTSANRNAHHGQHQQPHWVAATSLRSQSTCDHIIKVTLMPPCCGAPVQSGHVTDKKGFCSGVVCSTRHLPSLSTSFLSLSSCLADDLSCTDFLVADADSSACLACSSKHRTHNASHTY